MKTILLSRLLVLVLCTTTIADDYQFDRCRILPDAGHQVEFVLGNESVLTWHYGAEYPRPFFYPMLGPAGQSLTRMGHPGAPDHEHHRGIWFAHAEVNGMNFWSDQTETRIRQTQWLAYADGPDEAVMATQLVWEDGDGNALINQQTIAAVSRVNDGTGLELQLTFSPAGAEPVLLDKTNFGLLSIRVAKSLSAVFGGGQLSNSEMQTGEKAIFGKRAKWMDYSGPVSPGEQAPLRQPSINSPRNSTEGITLFDHPENPRYPTYWHVRDDGWMGASFCMQESYKITAAKSLVLRYFILTHSGAGADMFHELNNQHDAFGNRPGFEVLTRPKPHHQYGVQRLKRE